jgi:DNA invertase Pin-like site-specific DNA recombinase
MNAVAYLRVSTDEQASGNGLNAQIDACQAWADRIDAKIIDKFTDDGISGAKGLDKRPALLNAVTALKRGDVLIVAKRDRLGRDPILMAMIESAAARKGARVVSAAGEGTEGDTPTDVLMRRMVDAFSEYERLVIGARTKAALQAKIRRGERCGAVRYGYNLAKDGKTLKENSTEQRTVNLITKLRGGGMSLRKIAAELTTREIKTKAGGSTWSHGAVVYILARTPTAVTT